MSEITPRTFTAEDIAKTETTFTIDDSLCKKGAAVSAAEALRLANIPQFQEAVHQFYKSSSGDIETMAKCLDKLMTLANTFTQDQKAIQAAMGAIRDVTSS
jgi:hypothetical protein